MLKGWFKADEGALAFGLVGALVGLAVGEGVKPKGKKLHPALVAGAGATAALAGRAFVDPVLKAESQ